LRLISSPDLGPKSCSEQELIVKTAITRGGLANPGHPSCPYHSRPTPLRSPKPNRSGRSTTCFTEACVTARFGSGWHSSGEFQINLKGSLNALRPELDWLGTVQNGGLSGDINAVGAALTPGAALYPGRIWNHPWPDFQKQFSNLQRRGPIVRYRCGIGLSAADAVRDQLQVRQTQVRRQHIRGSGSPGSGRPMWPCSRLGRLRSPPIQSRILQQQSVKVEQETFGRRSATNYW